MIQRILTAATQQKDHLSSTAESGGQEVEAETGNMPVQEGAGSKSLTYRFKRK